MRLIVLAMLAASLSACGQSEAPATATRSAEMPTGSALDADAQSVFERAVAHPDRADSDRLRDPARKPADVMAFFGVEPGMRILDMYSGGGYYSELLARVVGDSGRILAHNNQAYLGFAGTEIDDRYAGDRLSNVERVMAENNELTLQPASLDAITLVLAYHDIYFVNPDQGWPEIDGPAMLAEFFQGLKPGGIVGIVDHYAADGAPPETGGTIHRIDKAIVVREMLAAGFQLDGESDLLRNPDDNHEISVFDPAIRGNTDRFLLRFRKPAS